MPLSAPQTKPTPAPPAAASRPPVSAEITAHMNAEKVARGSEPCQMPPSHAPNRAYSLPLTDAFGTTLNLEAVMRPWGPGLPAELRHGPRSQVVELVEPPADSTTFLRDFVHPGVPFVVRGYTRLAGWAAPVKWTNAYLREVIGHLPMPLRTSKFGDGIFHYAHGLSAAEERPTADFIDRINTSEAGRYYLAQGDLFGGRAPGRMAALLPDLAPPAWASALDLKHIQLWFGASRIVNPAHYDANENLLVMLDGRKTLTLFPPGARNFLAPRMHSTHSAPLTRMVDVRAVNDTRWPCFRHARAMATTLTLDAGDLLYLPPYWWHDVVSDNGNASARSLAVNFWYSVHSALLAQMMKAVDHSMLLERPDDAQSPPLVRQGVW